MLVGEGDNPQRFPVGDEHDRVRKAARGLFKFDLGFIEDQDLDAHRRLRSRRSRTSAQGRALASPA